MSSFESEYNTILGQLESSPFRHYLERIKSKSVNRPIILYGAGMAVGIILHVCRANNINITLLCDSNKTGRYKQSDVSLPIISPQELVEKHSDSSVIVTSWKFEKEIRENLKSIGFDDNNVFSFYYPQRITPKIFQKDYYDGYKWAYDFYEDEISKQLVLDKIKSYLTSEPLKPNTGRNIYSEDVFKFGEDEVLLDGAYDEDIIKNVNAFSNITKGRYKYIYVFKPENDTLKSDLDNYGNVEIFSLGLGSNERVETFFYNGLLSSGFVSCKYYATTEHKFSSTEFKTTEKNVVSIDGLIEKGIIKHTPTFIKLDIEGSEADALIGAADLIKNHKPKLAICAYHQPQDVYELPEIILSIRDDYKFMLRQHDYGYYETLLYAY